VAPAVSVVVSEVAVNVNVVAGVPVVGIGNSTLLVAVPTARSVPSLFLPMSKRVLVLSYVPAGTLKLISSPLTPTAR